MIAEYQVSHGSIEIELGDIEVEDHRNTPVVYYSQKVGVTVTLNCHQNILWRLQTSYYRNWTNYSDLDDPRMDTLICLEALLFRSEEPLTMLVEPEECEKLGRSMNVYASWLANLDWHSVTREELVYQRPVDAAYLPCEPGIV